MKTTVLTLSMAILLSACGGQQVKETSESSAASRVVAPSVQPVGARVYRVVTENNYPPFTLHDGKGKSLGFEVELLRAIAERENLHLSFTPHAWGVVLNLLKTGEADIVAAGLTVLEERKTDMLFTNPHFTTETAMLVSEAKRNKVKSFADLKEQRVSVKKDSLQHQLLKQMNHEPNLISFADTTWLNISRMLKGKSDVVLADWGVLAYHHNAYKDTMKAVLVRDEKAPKEDLAFAVKKDETALLQSLNSGLEKVKQDGTYQKLYDKWFGIGAPVIASSASNVEED